MNSHNAKVTTGMRVFLFIGLVCLIIAAYRSWSNQGIDLIWSITGGILVFIGIIRPLSDLIWGLVSTALLFLVYAIVILPFGLIGRLLGKTFLDLEFRSNKASYWIDRTKKPGQPN